MEKIYVTTNFLEVSESALNYAAELAKQTGAELTLIHAYHLFPYYSDMYATMRYAQSKRMKEDAEVKMRKWCEKNAPSDEFRCKIINREGLSRDVIIDVVNQSPPDLLIMGTHKAWLIDKVIFGSKTGQVLPEISCPLLVIPENTPYVPFSQIVFATDFQDSDLDSIQILVDLAAPLNGTIHVLHVVNDDDPTSTYDITYFEDFKKEVTSKVDYPHINFELVHATKLVKELNNYTKASNANLLVMSQTYKNWYVRLFHASVTQKQFYRITIPTLFFKGLPDDSIGDF